MEEEALILFFQSLSQFIRSKLQAKWAIKAGIAAGLAFFFGRWYANYVHESGYEKLISGLWCSLSAILVFQVHVGGAFKAGWFRLFGTFLGAILGSLFTYILGPNPISLAVGIAFALMLLSFLNIQAKQVLFLTMATIALVLILQGASHHINPWVFGFFRFVDACVGILISLLVSSMIWPEKAEEKLNLNMAGILSDIIQLFQDIFVADEERKGEAKIQELSLKLQKNLDYLEEAKLEVFLNRKKAEEWLGLHRQLTLIADLVFGLRLLDKKVLFETNQIESRETIEYAKDTLFISLQEAHHGLRECTCVTKDFPLADATWRLKKIMGYLNKENLSSDFIGSFYLFSTFYNEISQELEVLVFFINSLCGKKP